MADANANKALFHNPCCGFKPEKQKRISYLTIQKSTFNIQHHNLQVLFKKICFKKKSINTPQATAYRNGTKAGHLSGQSFDPSLHQYIHYIQRSRKTKKLWLSGPLDVKHSKTGSAVKILYINIYICI